MYLVVIGLYFLSVSKLLTKVQSLFFFTSNAIKSTIWKTLQDFYRPIRLSSLQIGREYWQI